MRKPGGSIRRVLVLLAALSLALLLLPLLPPPEQPLLGWGAFIGRFHPLLVHFPIVLILLPPLLEGWVLLRRRRTGLGLLPYLWSLALVSGLATVGAGYLLYASGDYAGDLVRSHLWAGVGLLFATAVTALVGVQAPIRASRRWHRLYLLLMVATSGVLLYTSHLGGSLTHGEGFLTDALPVWDPKALAIDARPQEELLVFQELLMPALEARCMNCHNPHKAKGGLVMDSFEAFQRGGDSGSAAFAPGDAAASELYRRVTLPPDDDDRMPPEGKPALDRDATALLRWWIDAGADPEMQLGNGPDDPALRAAVYRYLPRLVRTQRKRYRDARARAALAEDLRPRAEAWGLVLERDPTDTTHFALSMHLPPLPVTDETLSNLLPYADAFSTLSLVASEVTDDGLYPLSKMPNLQRLFLQKCDLDGSGLVYLQALPRLEVLNLSHTRLDDTGVLHVLQMPALKQLYLYNTAVTASVVEALQAHRPDIEVLLTEGPYY